MMTTNRIGEFFDDDDEPDDDDTPEQAQVEAPTEPYYQVAAKANRERDPERKRRILEMAAKLRAEQGGNDEVDDEDLATKIAYLRPIRDALFRWAEDRVGYGNIELNCFSDGSAAIEMGCNDGNGLRVVLNLTLEG